MSYTIFKSDGSALTSVVDGSIDQLSTDLTLIGKNSTGFGVFINDNFVKLLENFSNSSQPNYPLKGQLWFDTTENRLKVYKESSFPLIEYYKKKHLLVSIDALKIFTLVFEDLKSNINN